MRIISIVFIFLFASSQLLAQSDKKVDYLNEGDFIPEFKIPIENGDTILASQLRGKTIVLVFFATWCPPCLKELPDVQKEIWEKYKKQNNFQLFVVGRGHTIVELNNFKLKNSYTFPFVADTDRSIFSVFAKQNIPRMYLIDKQGKIIKMNGGFTPNVFNDFVELLDKELSSTN